MFKVKEYKDESQQRTIVWDTEKVNNLLKAMEEGYNPPDHPFYEANINYRKSNLVWQYTEHEMNEIKKCAKNVVYFANNYCKVMTDDGYQQIKLRDYQEKIIETYQQNRFSICVAPRQVGKCLLDCNLLIYNKITNTTESISIRDLYSRYNSRISILQKFKTFLYKLIQK